MYYIDHISRIDYFLEMRKIKFIFSSKTNACIQNNVSTLFSVTTLFREVETSTSTSNASYFAGLYEKWWRIRDAVAHTRSERLCHRLSVTIKRVGCRLVINGGAFLKLIGAGMQDRIPTPAGGTSHAGRSRDTLLCFRESPCKTVASPREIDIKIGAQHSNE